MFLVMKELSINPAFPRKLGGWQTVTNMTGGNQLKGIMRDLFLLESSVRFPFILEGQGFPQIRPCIFLNICLHSRHMNYNAKSIKITTYIYVELLPQS